jgi:hypothetical protein
MDEALAVAIAGFVLSLIAAVLAWAADRKASHALEVVDADQTREMAVTGAMQIGTSSRVPDYIPAERMRIQRPPGRHS